MNLSDRINGFVKLGEEFNLLLEGCAKTQAGTKLVELLPDLFFAMAGTVKKCKAPIAFNCWRFKRNCLNNGFQDIRSLFQ